MDEFIPAPQTELRTAHGTRFEPTRSRQSRNFRYREKAAVPWSLDLAHKDPSRIGRHLTSEHFARNAMIE
jgi:hypothetical protein